MQAIEVKFLGPTNYRGARYNARAEAGTVTIEHDYSKSPEANAAEAARTLAEKLGWNYGPWHGGFTASGLYVFVCVILPDAPAFVLPK